MSEVVYHHMALNCKDAIATENWYVKHFGFERTRVLPLGDDQIVFIRAGQVYLELFQAKGEAPGQPAGGDGPQYSGWRHIGFKVDDVDAKLAAMGDDARVTFGPMSFDDFISGWRTAWVADPDGNIVEISQGYVDPATAAE
jgi:glyoxylase I family protein